MPQPLENKTLRPRRSAFTAVIGLFVLQIVLVFILGERAENLPPAETFPTDISLAADTSAEAALAAAEHIADPTVFALPGRHNFSSKLWLEYSKPNYHLTNWSEPPRWLEIPTNTLGSLVHTVVARDQPKPVLIADKPLPAYSRGSLSTDAPLLAASSTLRLEGDLAQRRLLTTPELPDWPHSELLTNSVVRVLANPGGQVISCALLDSCGLKEADQFALNVAANLRFKPEFAGDGDKTRSHITRGLVIFEWRTLEHPTTARTATITP